MAEPSTTPIVASGPEEWRAVVGFEGWYEVSSHGRLRRVGFFDADRWRRRKEPRMMKCTPNSRLGYVTVTLCKQNTPTPHRMHKLVAAAFLGARPEGLEIAHLDNDKANNSVDNLAYVTRSENYWHSEAFGTRAVGPRHGKTGWRNSRYEKAGHPR